MKIVHIEDFFHPEAGYQVNVLAKYMAHDGHQVTVITSELDRIPDYLTRFFGKNDIQDKDKAYCEKYNVEIVRLPLLAYISGRSVYRFSSVIDQLKRIKPDVVFVHGNDTLIGIQMIMLYARQTRKRRVFKLVLDSHMLEMASRNPFRNVFYFFYRKIVTPHIIKNDLTVIRTQDSDFVEKKLGIPIGQAPLITLGADRMLFYPDKEAKNQFRKDHKIEADKMIVIYAGKLDEQKGGLFLAEMLSEGFEETDNIVMLLVGTPAGPTADLIKKKLNESRVRVIQFPTQTYVNLPKYYAVADVAVFPRQCSLSFYDVQACGLPVVFEDNEINKKRTEYGTAFTFCADNKDDLKSKIMMLKDMHNLQPDRFDDLCGQCVDSIKNHYDYEQKYKEYMKYMKEGKNDN